MKIEDQDPLIGSRPTINPYRTAAGLVFDRLRWDLHPESWRSRARLKALRDAYHGEKAVILCNGPSLNKVNFDFLEGVFCFGLNKINLLFDRSNFRPNAVVAVNRFVIEQNAAFFNSTDIPLFISKVGLGHIRRRRNVAFLPSTNVPRFARDVSISCYEGHTVTYVALQLAFHMGFRQVALVGADHTFASKGPANMTVTAGEADESHFDPRYFSGGVQWQLPDLFQSEVAYTMARDTYAAFGGRIVNATDGGKLEVFDRLPIRDFVHLSASNKSD